MTSRWEGVPLDIIREEFRYLDNAKDIKAFCKDHFIYEKLCKDENGEIWEYLYQRDFSDEIKLRKGDTIMKKYLRQKSIFEKRVKELSEKDLYRDAVNQGYENYLKKNVDNIPKDMGFLAELIDLSIRNCKTIVFPFLLNLTENYITDLTFSHYVSIVLQLATLNNCFPIVEYILKTYPNLDVWNIPAIAKSLGYHNIADILEKYVSSSGLGEIQQITANSDSSITDVVPQSEVSKITKSPKRITPKISKSAKISKSPKTVTSQDTSTKCTGTTKTGKQCCRKAEDGSQYCFQHK